MHALHHPSDRQQCLSCNCNSLSRRGGTLGWGHLITGELVVYDVPGEHLTLLHPPHVQVLANYLKRRFPKPPDVKTRARTA